MKSEKTTNKLPESLKFYCKDCHKLVETTAVGQKFVYRCKICSTKNVAFGSEKSLRNFYRIKEEGQTTTLSQEEKRALDADKL
jgi:hypothetical protein